MPFRRHLYREFVEALRTSTFWPNVCSDLQLQPEIRDDVITVYFCGQALVRKLQFQSGVLSAQVHHKFVPLQRTKPSFYLPLASNNPDGFAFKEELQAQPLHQCQPEILRSYKRLMKFEAGPEDILQQKIITRPKNLVIDQQIEFRSAGSDTIKIDLCYYDPSIERIVFAEIKRVDDSRLIGTDNVPEVIAQLRSYTTIIRREHHPILTGVQNVIQLKRDLGLGNRLTGVPNQDLVLEPKPLLIIGNCTDQEVRQIQHARTHRQNNSPWSRLWDHIEDVACGILICGEDGCRLFIRTGRQRYWFGG